MDIETRKKYDSILEIIKKQNGSVGIFKFIKICADYKIKTEDAVYFFTSWGLIDSNSETSIVLTEKGNNFIGFVKSESQSKRDYKLSKFKYYTFWPVFVIGLIGGGLGIASYFNEKESEGVTREEMNQQIEDLKKQHDEDIIHALDIVYGDEDIVNQK